MLAKNLKCLKCKEIFPLQLIYNCPKCGWILDVEYDYGKIGKEELLANFRKGKSIWRFNSLLPIKETSKIISLDEGLTPLFQCRRLSENLGIPYLYIKDETRNPTGSFKDRPICVAISKANEEGKDIVITSSSGNAGASVAAYAAKGGMKAIVTSPSTTPLDKLLQIAAYGATFIRVKGNYSDCFRLTKEVSLKFGWVNLTSTFLNPFATEGDKTVAYELYEQLEGLIPNWILIPVGTGPLLFGCYKGFKELKKFGLISSLPSMVCVQAEGCSPIVRAFENQEQEVKAWGTPQTIASGIADPLEGYPQDGTLTLQIIRESRGVAVAVRDDELLESVSMLAKLAGIFAEPTGAASIAGAKKLIEKGVIKENEIVVCVVTGIGFKDLESIKKKVEIPEKEIEPEVKALEEILRKKGFLKKT